MDEFPTAEGPATIQEALASETVMWPVCRWHYLQGQAAKWFFEFLGPIAIIGLSVGLLFGGPGLFDRVMMGVLGALVAVSIPYWSIILSQVVLNISQNTP